MGGVLYSCVRCLLLDRVVTKGNKNRLDNVVTTLVQLAINDKDAQHSALVLLDVNTKLNTVLQDLVLRPEVNS